MEGNGQPLLFGGLGRLGELPLQVGQDVGELGAGPGERSLGRETVDEAEQLVVVVHGPLVEGVDVGTPVHLDGHPALVLEHDQRLAHRDPAHPQVLGDGVLRHPHAGPEHTVEDERPDVQGDVVGTAGADEPFFPRSTDERLAVFPFGLREVDATSRIVFDIQVASRAWPRVASCRKGTSLSAGVSRGMPRTRSAMMLRWICSVPPPILLIH